MKILNAHLIGRFGNQVLTYLCARGIAEEFGAQLRTSPWPGQRIFQLNEPPIQEQSDVKSDENNLVASDEGICDFQSYAQNQKAVDFYSRSDVKRWLVWRPEILHLLHENVATPCVVIHLRRGDYKNSSGYPLISKECAVEFLKSIGEDYYNVVSDEVPTVCGKFTEDLAWLPDFWKLMNAEILVRANSSFSFCAHLLANDTQRVFSPIIDNAIGGHENEVEFVEGNHPKLSTLPMCSDLHLRP